MANNDLCVLVPSKDPAERKRPRRFCFAAAASPPAYLVEADADEHDPEAIESDATSAPASDQDSSSSEDSDAAANATQQRKRRRRTTELAPLRRAVDEMQSQVLTASAQIAELRALVATLAQHQQLQQQQIVVL